MANQEIIEVYGGKLRVRACALIFDQPEQPQSILLLESRNLYAHPFWMPPGGGVQLGETLIEAVQREVLEETGLQVAVGDLWYISEYIKPPLHALEVYFEAKIVSGTLTKGFDPELQTQLIQQVQFVPLHQLDRLGAIYPAFLKHELPKCLTEGKPQAPRFIPQ